MTISNLIQNNFIGIGISLVFWLALNSKSGNDFLGNYNVFSFVFRDTNLAHDWNWLLGKGIALALTILMFLVQPVIIKKRG